MGSGDQARSRHSRRAIAGLRPLPKTHRGCLTRSMAPPLSADWTTSPAARPRLAPRHAAQPTPAADAIRCAPARGPRRGPPSKGTTSRTHAHEGAPAQASGMTAGRRQAPPGRTTCGKSGLPRSGPIQPCQPEPAPNGTAKTLIASAQRAVARGGTHTRRCLAGNLSKPSSVCSTAASL